MSKLMSHVRGYVPLQVGRYTMTGTILDADWREKRETPLAPRNVQKNELFARICGVRRERQLGFLRNSASKGIDIWHYSSVTRSEFPFVLRKRSLSQASLAGRPPRQCVERGGGGGFVSTDAAPVAPKGRRSSGANGSHGAALVGGVLAGTPSDSGHAAAERTVDALGFI
jgi:hypothetical protein